MNKNNCQAIHETVLKDIIDLYDSIKKSGGAKNLFGKKKDSSNPIGSTSLAKESSNLVLVFPVICSRGISIENSSMISKAIEKNCVTMLQRLFAAYQVQDVNNVKNYISKFHTNLSTQSASLDDIFDIVDNYGESAKLSGFEESAYNNAIRSDMRNLNYYLPTSVNESSLNRFIVSEGAVDDDVAHLKKKIKDLEGEVKAAKNHSASDIESNQSSIIKNKSEVFGKQVMDSEFKKANELMPTQMIINFKYVSQDEDGNDLPPIPVESGIVGVKAKLYPISSDDIVKHLTEKTNDRNWLTNFFRATTREISFVKDFVLALDKAKIEAMSMSLRNSTSDKMWKVLERRATVSRLKRGLRQNNSAAAAITTLCISQEEVEYMRKNYNIDIERLNVALGLFDSLNLMGICIVDESLEVAKFIYDEKEPSWETISFTHLERESSDNTYKRVVNLMTKISR